MIVLRLKVWRVVLSDSAVRQFRGIPRSRRSEVKDGMHLHLQENNPAQAGRNKFRLRRPSEFAEFELRIGAWRVFYRVREGVTEVVLIGEKRGSKLFVEGEEFEL